MFKTKREKYATFKVSKKVTEAASLGAESQSSRTAKRKRRLQAFIPRAAVSMKTLWMIATVPLSSGKTLNFTADD